MNGQVLRTPRLSLVAFALCASLGACDTASYDNNESLGFVVPEGKEDDFLSTTAAEYVFTGRATVQVSPGEGLAEAKKLIGLKHTAIAWFLNEYLIDKTSSASNASYGGFNAMVKNGSYQDLAIIDKGDGVFEFTFSQVVAGNKLLLQRLPKQNGKLRIEIGKPSNAEMAQLETGHEWYRQAPWANWNPTRVTAAQKETIEFALAPEVTSKDAWWDYQRLLSDDKLTIDVHYGWDPYHAIHTTDSRDLYNTLVELGFTSPVSEFEQYTRTSGALTTHLTANNRDIEVQIRIYYGRVGADNDPDTDAGGRVLENDVRESLKNSDIIIYSGHSGAFFGFSMANWQKTEEGDLDDSELATAEMPSDRYQIVVAEGCDTYMLGHALKTNPSKRGANIDIMTTTSFADAKSAAAVEMFLGRLLENKRGELRPAPVATMLSDIKSLERTGFSTLYGVHGIDDNPQLHPFADLAKSCNACQTNADCGASGNSCVRLRPGTAPVCAAACTTDAACPADYACKQIAIGNAAKMKACVPRTLRCQ